MSSRSQDQTIREKLFTLSRTQHEDMWRRFKQTNDRRIAERLHGILLLDSGQNTDSVSRILHTHPKTLKRWVNAFASGGEAALTRFNYAGSDGWLTDEQQHQFWLQEPRQLILGAHFDAASADFRVGYDDAAYFNREYKSLFGVPSMRDVERLRESVRESIGR